MPLAAVQLPRFTGAAVAPAAIAPVYEPVRVLTMAPLRSATVSVMPCAPAAEAMVPWFLHAAVNVTVLPAAGLLGVQRGGRDQVGARTGVTTSAVGLV